MVERGLGLCGDDRDIIWARLTLLRGRIEPLASGAVGAAHWLGHDALSLTIASASGNEDDYASTLEALECRTPEETSKALALARTWQRPKAIMRALSVLGRDLLKGRDTLGQDSALYQELGLSVRTVERHISDVKERSEHTVECRPQPTR